MTIAALIRKRGTVKPANDNPANSDNDGQATGRPLAGLAALALANPPVPSRQISPAQAANETAPEPYVDRRELAHIVAVFHRAAGDDDVVIGECVRDALQRPALAIECYRELMRRRLTGEQVH